MVFDVIIPLAVVTTMMAPAFVTLLDLDERISSCMAWGGLAVFIACLAYNFFI